MHARENPLPPVLTSLITLYKLLLIFYCMYSIVYDALSYFFNLFKQYTTSYEALPLIIYISCSKLIRLSPNFIEFYLWLCLTMKFTKPILMNLCKFPPNKVVSSVSDFNKWCSVCFRTMQNVAFIISLTCSRIFLVQLQFDHDFLEANNKLMWF